MTDMQLLLPPLEGNSDEDASSDVEGEGPRTQDVAKDANGSRSVLPPELRDRFEVMKSMWRRSQRQNVEGNDDETNSRDLKRKQRELAVETALAVDDEVSRLRGGIAELEALLNVHEAYGEEEDDEGGFQDAAVDNVVLPSIVPVEDDNDLCRSAGNRDSIEHGVEKEETESTVKIMGPPATS